MKRNRTLLEVATDQAFAQMEASDNNPLRLAVELQTVVLITAAQGVIDNGGFRYFFEADFPGNPSYTVFADAYRRIGATEAATALEQAAGLFGFPDPHLYATRRGDFLDSGVQGVRELVALGDTVCGDEAVWSNLSQYVAANAGAFPSQPVHRKRR